MGRHIQIPGIPPGMPIQQAVVKIAPCEAKLLSGRRFCFHPDAIKAIQENSRGCLLWLAGWEKPFELACSYETFIDRAGLDPQRLEAEEVQTVERPGS